MPNWEPTDFVMKAIELGGRHPSRQNNPSGNKGVRLCNLNALYQNEFGRTSDVTSIVTKLRDDGHVRVLTLRQTQTAYQKSCYKRHLTGVVEHKAARLAQNPVVYPSNNLPRGVREVLARRGKKATKK